MAQDLPADEIRQVMLRSDSELQSDLPKVSARLLQLERLGNVSQRKGSVDDRLYPRGLDSTDKLDLMLPASDNQTLNTLLPTHGRSHRNWTSHPRQDADECNMTADACRLYGLRQSAYTPEFDDVIHPAATSDLQHASGPLRFFAIIDAVISAQLAHTLELVVGG